MNRGEFDALVADLKGNDGEQSNAAATRLENWQPDADQGIRLIETAATLVGDTDQCVTLASRLLQPCWKHPHDRFTNAIRKTYASFCREGASQWQALRVLTELRTERTLKTFVELLHLPESRRVSLEMALIPLTGSFWGSRCPPPEAHVMFPEWFSLVDHLNDTYHVYSFIAECQAAHIFEYGEYPDFVTDCVKRAKRDLGELQNLDRHSNHKRSLAAQRLEWLLDLFCDMENPEIAEVIAQSLRVRDLPIQLFAACTALARGIEIPSGILTDVAASPSMRHRLWRVLEHKGLLHFFPHEYRSTARLSEANMVQWLEFPTEMGRAPEEIEPLIVVESVNDAGDELESHFFRFRHREFLDGEWLVGLGGTYLKAAEPTLSGESTFSRFLPLDSMSIEEHVAYYLNDKAD